MINLFNAHAYLRQNPDVAKAVEQGHLTAEQHFELYGQAEGRSPGPFFDVDYYLAANPDVAAAAGDNKGFAYTHFVHHGINEGRSSVAFFDSEFYLAQNPDVAQAVKDGLGTAIQHFLMYGLNESRQVSVSLNVKDYLEANPDVDQAVKKGHTSGLHHLLTYGISEGRDLGNGISLKDFANDPLFNEALAKGKLDAALARVDEIAPFIPEFKAPANWKLAADTPLPTDFVPIDGKILVTPKDLDLPEGSPLPPAFGSQPPPTPGVPENPKDEGTTPGDSGITNPEESAQPQDEAIPDIFSDWKLVLPSHQSIMIIHEGKINNVTYEDNSHLSLSLLQSNPSQNKLLYLEGNSTVSSSQYNTIYTGGLYLFDAQEGMKNLGIISGASSNSPNGDIAFFGAQSMVVSADLNHYSPSSLAIPIVNSQIVWNEDSSQVWFSTNSAPYGTELFSYTINADLGLEGGLVKDVSPGSASGINNYYFEESFALLPNGNAVFYAGDSTYWISDGTEENTQPLDFLDHYSFSYPYYSPISTFQDKAVLGGTTRDSNYQYTSSLIMTKGNEQGTVFIDLEQDYTQPEILWTTEDTLFFSAENNGKTIFKTDSQGNHEKLMDVKSVSVLGHNQEKAFLSIHDDTHGEELWVMDSQTGESQLVKDILPGSGSSLGQYPTSMMVNDKLLFSAYTSATKQQLFVSDGTESGTVALSNGAAIHLLTVDDFVFYSENNGLYAVNTALKAPTAVLVKDYLPSWSIELEHDEDQIFFRDSENTVYSYNWETDQLEKLMDYVDAFSVVEENIVFGLSYIPDYSYDAETGITSHYQALEWILSDGTTEGTESIKIKLNDLFSYYAPHYNPLKNATLLPANVEQVGSLSLELGEII